MFAAGSCSPRGVPHPFTGILKIAPIPDRQKCNGDAKSTPQLEFTVKRGGSVQTVIHRWGLQVSHNYEK